MQDLIYYMEGHNIYKGQQQSTIYSLRRVFASPIIFKIQLFPTPTVLRLQLYINLKRSKFH